MATYINVGSYKINNRRKLGSGTFGTVYKGKHVTKGTEVAAKNVTIDGSQESREFVMREVNSLSRVKHHPYLLQLKEHQFIQFQDEDGVEVNELWLFTEFCPEGNLAAYHKSRDVPFEQKAKLALQCASALAFLHSLSPPILHRDIKPGNILIKDLQGNLTAKVADFGLSQDANQTAFSTVGGSPNYMAPELFGSKPKYGKEIDVFSLGVLYDIFFKAPPRQDLDEDDCKYY